MAGHESGPLTRVLEIDELKFARCNLIKVDVEGMCNKNELTVPSL